jgi:hypothetical protein
MGYNILIYKCDIEVVNLNTTNVNMLRNITDPTDLVYNINDVSGGILGITIIFVVYIILFLSVFNSTQDLKQSFNASTYISMILVWLLWILNLVATTWLYIFLLLSIVGIISLFVRRDM